MSLIDLIQTNQEAAKEAIAAAMQNKVFDYLDNYKLDEEVVARSVKKDKHGHILSMETVPDKDKTASHGVTQGSVKKDSKGNVLSFKTEDFEAMTQEEFDSIDEEQLDELSKTTLANYMHKATNNLVKHNSDRESHVANVRVLDKKIDDLDSKRQTAKVRSDSDSESIKRVGVIGKVFKSHEDAQKRSNGITKAASKITDGSYGK